LESFQGTITATVGTSFNHTHPDAIEWLTRIGADLRVFHDGTELFHPKVYLFTSDEGYALFVGSSNLTYGGFYSNVEINSLIEGEFAAEESEDVCSLRKRLSEWHSPIYSFQPDKSWLAEYRKDYARTAHAAITQGIKTPARSEEGIGTASWLRNADWTLYYEKVIAGLSQHGRTEQRYHDVLDAAVRSVPVPWMADYFADAEKRRIIGGMEPYGWLGHVAAAGRFRRLMAKGPESDWVKIANCINTASSLTCPIPWKKLQGTLEELLGLGFTMKVWGRLLCIVRPDLYCTVASVSVRKNLSRTLGVAPSLFEKPEGYVQLIRLVHESPWFNSKPPSDRRESTVWGRRVAFMDAIFY
jgi:hypothetical protein